jgi:hypothetical protein
MMTDQIASESIGNNFSWGKWLTVKRTCIAQFKPISDTNVAKTMSFSTGKWKEIRRDKSIEIKNSGGPLDRINHH